MLDGKPWGWFAATYKLLDEAYRETVRALKPVIKSANATDKRIELITGGTLEGWSLQDPNAGRSRKYAGVVIDEAGMVPNLGEIYNEAIRATLADMQGEAWFFGTPKGMNYFHTVYGKGLDPSESLWSSWQMPTLSNPYIRPEELEIARAEMPDRAFRQEFEAEFLEDAGGVFQGVRECIGSHQLGGGASLFGLDLARTQDYTVLTGLSPGGVQTVYDRWNKLPWEATVERVARQVRQHPGATLTVDSTGVGDPVFEMLRTALPGVRLQSYKFTHESKRQLIENLQVQIERRSISLFNDPTQTTELLAYEYAVTKAGTVTMNAPEGMHDDTVIGLALAAWEFRPATPGFSMDLDDWRKVML